MMMLYIVSAILLMVLGHVIKSLRWKQLISIYEDVEVSQLLLSMSIGQAINMVIPFRIGDVFRIWRVGKKNLDNGFVLSLTTVIVDIFIDTVTVGMAFIFLYVLGIHKDIVEDMAFQYGILSVIVVIICILAVVLKKKVKKWIQKVACIFNTNIERKLLMTSYTLLTSIKDVFKKQNIMRVFVYTIGVWTCYFLSYNFFAAFLQQRGFNFTLTGVFKTIFSMSGDALFVECVRMGEDISWSLWFGLYFLFPPTIILVAIYFYGKIYGSKSRRHKSKRIIPQINETERLAFLSIYFDEDNKEYFNSYLSMNKDVGVLCDCSAGSNATTILAMNENTTFYRKYAFGVDAKKLNEQIEWLEKNKNQLPLCNILSKHCEDEICYYDMECLSNALGFFQYIHTSSLEQGWDVLNQVLDLLNNQLYLPSMKSAEVLVIKKYINKKVLANITICDQWCKKYYKELSVFSTVVINGNEYHNLEYYKKYFNADYLSAVFDEDAWSTIHGDLTIENIVCIQREQNNWYLIDPNTGNVHETPYLDYAKLLQSLHGKYEFLMMVKDVKVFENQIEFVFTGSMAYQMLYDKYKRYLFKCFSFKQVRSIFYHEAVHWLRLMPYKIHKDPQMAIIFYAGMLMVLNDIEEMFETETAESKEGIEL